MSPLADSNDLNLNTPIPYRSEYTKYPTNVKSLLSRDQTMIHNMALSLIQRVSTFQWKISTMVSHLKTSAPHASLQRSRHTKTYTNRSPTTLTNMIHNNQRLFLGRGKNMPSIHGKMAWQVSDCSAIWDLAYTYSYSFHCIFYFRISSLPQRLLPIPICSSDTRSAMRFF
jgi:hypothetical protein